ncbi:unnamed protein product, partial [Ectocarpus sp. 12 AP-2014]
ALTNQSSARGKNSHTRPTLPVFHLSKQLPTHISTTIPTPEGKTLLYDIFCPPTLQGRKTEAIFSLSRATSIKVPIARTTRAINRSKRTCPFPQRQPTTACLARYRTIKLSRRHISANGGARKKKRP